MPILASIGLITGAGLVAKKKYPVQFGKFEGLGTKALEYLKPKK